MHRSCDKYTLVKFITVPLACIQDSVSDLIFVSSVAGMFVVDTLLQRTNSYNSLPMCVNLCLERLLDCENRLPQTKHS